MNNEAELNFDEVSCVIRNGFMVNGSGTFIEKRLLMQELNLLDNSHDN